MRIAEAFLHNEMNRSSIHAGGPGSGPQGSGTAKNTKSVSETGKSAMSHGYVKTNGVARHYYLPDKVNNPKYEHQVQIHDNGSWTHREQNGKKATGNNAEDLHQHLSKLHGGDVNAGGPGSGPQGGGGKSGAADPAPHPKLADAHALLEKHGYSHTHTSTPGYLKDTKYEKHPNNQNYHYSDNKGNHVMVKPSGTKAEFGGKLGMWQHSNDGKTVKHGDSSGLARHLNKYHADKE